MAEPYMYLGLGCGTAEANFSGMSNHVKISISHKMFHNDSSHVIIKARASYRRTPEGKVVVNVGKLKLHDQAGSDHLANPSLRQDIRSSVVSFANDTRYPIIWNEDTGFECHVSWHDRS